ncbi:tRNA dihydrouridine(20/20a) synthase DusA [Aurantivibrio plasticivorans]
MRIDYSLHHDRLMPAFDHRFCIAPMIDWSDRHCRYFWRLLTKHAVVYTEMITTGAILHGDRDRHLRFSHQEHPIAIQLGGSDPTQLAECAKIAEDWGYDEINLNCGCPSDRVQSGKFGACLMLEPELVAECFQAMNNVVNIPVTIKHRIGVDEQDEYEDLEHFVRTLASAECNTFIVHARKAWLQGLSPKQNREVPPLNYERVYQLKRDYPSLEIILNGGITTLEQSQTHLRALDGVMVGREAYHNPFMLADVDSLLFDENIPQPSRESVLRGFMEYCRDELAHGARLNHLSRHILGLFHGQPGGKKFRRHISEHAHLATSNEMVFEQAIALVR